MGIKLKGFNKKKKEEEIAYIEDLTKVDGKKLTKNQVRVILFNKLSKDLGHVQEAFICDRYKDPQSGVTRIENKDKKFNVLEPGEDEQVVTNMSNKDINARLAKIEELLTDRKGKPNPKINEKDLIVEKAKLNVNLERNKYKNADGGFGSYYYIGQDGSKCLTFVEENDEYIPVRFNWGTYTIHTDCGSKKKPASVAMSNTLKKFESKIAKALEGRLAWFFTVVVIALIINVAAAGFLLKKYHEYDEMFEGSNYVKLQTQMTNTTYGCLEKLQELQTTGQISFSDQQINDIKYQQTKTSNGNS